MHSQKQPSHAHGIRKIGGPEYSKYKIHKWKSPTRLPPLLVGGAAPPPPKEGTVDASNVSVMLEAFQIMLAGEYWLRTSNASALSAGLLQMD